MKDRKKLEPMLRSFKNGNIDIEYAVNFILHTFSVSKHFNPTNFLVGMTVGGLIGLISMAIATS